MGRGKDLEVGKRWNYNNADMTHVNDQARDNYLRIKRSFEEAMVWLFGWLIPFFFFFFLFFLFDVWKSKCNTALHVCILKSSYHICLSVCLFIYVFGHEAVLVLIVLHYPNRSLRFLKLFLQDYSRQPKCYIPGYVGTRIYATTFPVTPIIPAGNMAQPKIGNLCLVIHIKYKMKRIPPIKFPLSFSPCSFSQRKSRYR